MGTGRDLSVPNPDINNPVINDPKIHNKDINFDENESEMILNEYGIIANNQLEWLEIQYPYVKLHAYIIMPNHIHAVIEIDSLNVNPIHKDNIVQLDAANIKIKSLSQIMGAFKTTNSSGKL